MKQNGPTMKTKEPTTVEIQARHDSDSQPFLVIPHEMTVNVPWAEGIHRDRGVLLKRLRAAELWMGKATHLNHCMRLDPYDERDHGCTCGLEELLNRSDQDGGQA